MDTRQPGLSLGVQPWAKRDKRRPHRTPCPPGTWCFCDSSPRGLSAPKELLLTWVLSKDLALAQVGSTPVTSSNSCDHTKIGPNIMGAGE